MDVQTDTKQVKIIYVLMQERINMLPEKVKNKRTGGRTLQKITRADGHTIEKTRTHGQTDTLENRMTHGQTDTPWQDELRIQGKISQ